MSASTWETIVIIWAVLLPAPSLGSHKCQIDERLYILYVFLQLSLLHCILFDHSSENKMLKHSVPPLVLVCRMQNSARILESEYLSYEHGRPPTQLNLVILFRGDTFSTSLGHISATYRNGTIGQENIQWSKIFCGCQWFADFSNKFNNISQSLPTKNCTHSALRKTTIIWCIMHGVKCM